MSDQADVSTDAPTTYNGFIIVACGTGLPFIGTIRAALNFRPDYNYRYDHKLLPILFNGKPAGEIIDCSAIAFPEVLCSDYIHAVEWLDSQKRMPDLVVCADDTGYETPALLELAIKLSSRGHKIAWVSRVRPPLGIHSFQYKPNMENPKDSVKVQGLLSKFLIDSLHSPAAPMHLQFGAFQMDLGFERPKD